MIPEHYAHELYHHGIKGQKWGVRRFQNADGSLKSAGKKRYNERPDTVKKAKIPYLTRMRRKHAGPGIYVGTKAHQLSGAKRDLSKLDRGEHLSVGLTKKRQAALDKRDRKLLEKKISKLEGDKNEASEKKGLTDKQKKALKIGAAVAATALAAYGAKKLSDYAKDKAFEKAYERGSNATLKFMNKYDTANAVSNFKTRHVDGEFFKTNERGDKMFNYMLSQDMAYAKRASSNTVSAVKTLMGKNREIPIGELMNAGIKVFIPDLTMY